MIAFASFSIFPSEDGSRMFWAAEVSQGWVQLQTLSQLLNDILARKILARPYHSDARFHCSFAHCSLQVSQRTITPDIIQHLETKFGPSLRACLATHIDQIGITAGNKTYFLDF